MQGPFALSLNGGLRKILNTWGSRLTRTTQREHAAQIVGGMDAFLSMTSYGQGQEQGSVSGLGQDQEWPGQSSGQRGDLDTSSYLKYHLQP